VTELNGPATELMRSGTDGKATLKPLGAPDSPPVDFDGPNLKSIGRYQLLEKLGEGGMGQVWLAEQARPVKRRVALKLIKAGMHDDTMLHRFESERQSLAMMDHPAIAKVFDAGTTPAGQPYFVMEYVPGSPITEYCDRNGLTIRQRLELFIQACDAVQHAHQKSVLHRDLKPANVLVVEVDGKPAPRIIDFGLAKSLVPHGLGQTTITLAGAPLGSPAYMSPEQADPQIADVDTRTDVYSLGVLLYELLTAALPFDLAEWELKPLDFVLRQIREMDPPRPSVLFNKKLSNDPVFAKAAAGARGSSPQQLGNSLRGDLDWMVIKAIEKDRARRYGTPSELAADISRYLNDEPVLAGPASTAHRLRKYVARHRGAVAVAAAALVVLTAFLIIQTMQLRKTTRERDRAARVTDFMTRIFKVSNPSEARGSSITAREILDTASGEIDTNLTQDPVLQAQMMSVMGEVYENLGIYERAKGLRQKAVHVQQTVLGPENPETLRSETAVARILREQGAFTEAEALQRPTLETQKRVLGPEHPDTLSSMQNLAYILWGKGRYSDAENLDRQTLEIRRRVLGPENLDSLASSDGLARDLESEDKIEETEKLYQENLAIRRRILGPDNLETLTAMDNLAEILALERRFPEAQSLIQQTIDIRRQVLGPEHPDTLKSMGTMATMLFEMNRFEDGEKLLKETLAIQRRVLAPDSPATALSMYNLACIYARQGHTDEAFAYLIEGVDHGMPPFVELNIEKDSDLESLHEDPRFTSLVAHAKDRALAQKSK
jgi:eukaryotic-like serine/threonine-protein kinase